MPKLMLDNCCFCWDLRSGCLIIAYINLISQSFGVLVSFAMLIAGAVFYTKNDPDLNDLALPFVVAGVICLIFAAISLTFAIVFIVGLKKYKPRHILVYIVYSWVALVIYCIGFIGSMSYTPTAGSIISGIIGIVYAIYLTLVVRSYYYQMLQELTTSPNVQHQS